MVEFFIDFFFFLEPNFIFRVWIVGMSLSYDSNPVESHISLRVMSINEIHGWPNDIWKILFFLSLPILIYKLPNLFILFWFNSKVYSLYMRKKQTFDGEGRPQKTKLYVSSSVSLSSTGGDPTSIQWNPV